jgi:cysteine desulfurase
MQPVANAAAVVHAAGGLLHVDAVQGPGRCRCEFNELGADLLTLSAHKMGGLQGVGALVVREGLHLDPLIKGGGQERGARGGTENLAGIAGFGAAAAEAAVRQPGEAATMAALRNRLDAGLRAVASDIVIFGDQSERLPNTTLFAVPGTKAETVVIAFDLEGIAVSSGAACSSGKVAPSHVLQAMGVPLDLASGAIRVSLGYSTTESDIESILNAWARMVEGLYSSRKRKGFAA